MGLSIFDSGGLSIFGNIFRGDVEFEGDVVFGGLITGSASDGILFGSTLLFEAATARLEIKNASKSTFYNLKLGTLQVATSLNIVDTKAIKAGTSGLDDDYCTLEAHDNDAANGTTVEIARLQGASDPSFKIGNNGNAIQGTYAGLVGFHGATAVAQQAADSDATGALVIDTTVNKIVDALQAYGLMAAST